MQQHWHIASVSGQPFYIRQRGLSQPYQRSASTCLLRHLPLRDKVRFKMNVVIEQGLGLFIYQIKHKIFAEINVPCLRCLHLHSWTYRKDLKCRRMDWTQVSKFTKFALLHLSIIVCTTMNMCKFVAVVQS